MLLYFDIICPTLASPTEISKSRQAQSRNTQRQLPPFTKPTKTSQSVYDNTNTDGTQGKDREENTNSAHRTNTNTLSILYVEIQKHFFMSVIFRK